MIKSPGARYSFVQNERRAVCDATHAYFGLTSIQSINFRESGP